MSTLLTDNIGDSGAVKTVPISSVTENSTKTRWLYDQSVPSTLSSFNLSSITDVTTGDYDTNYTNSMTDSNYTELGMWVNSTNAGADRTLQTQLGARLTTGSSYYAVANAVAFDNITSGITLGDLA